MILTENCLKLIFQRRLPTQFKSTSRVCRGFTKANSLCAILLNAGWI